MNTLESENDRYSEELAVKASRLKHIAFDIEKETREHNHVLDSMYLDFNKARSFLGGSARHFTYVISSGRGDRRIMCYVIAAIVCSFFFLYYTVSSFRNK